MEQCMKSGACMYICNVLVLCVDESAHTLRHARAGGALVLFTSCRRTLA